MDPFPVIRSIAVPLLHANIDTDVITPMRRIVSGNRDDLVRYAFEPLRYLPDGSLDPDFVLNRPLYQDAEILLCGPNFGCGSSRETAVTAIRGLGFRVLIAPSFGGIFHDNCFQNGVLPVVLPLRIIQELADEAGEEQAAGPPFQVELAAQRIVAPSARAVPFEVNPARREALLSGLDDIDLSLQQQQAIAAFQDRDRLARPWVYETVDA